MGGECLRNYWTKEMRAVLERYRQFEALIPSGGGGSDHNGEDGRYVESILKETLKKYLPAGVELLSGFILRAGVKSGFSGKDRKNDEDRHSSQLDIIVYDSGNYPVYQRFGDTAVVIPEGVLAVISVKKTLRTNELRPEIKALGNAGRLCAFRDRKGPFLALVGMDDQIRKGAVKAAEKVIETEREIVKECVLEKRPVCYEEMPGFIGNLRSWTVHKAHKKEKKCAEYQVYVNQGGEEHLGLQYLLKGILDVYYSRENNHGKQPGFVGFPSGKQYEGAAVSIEYDKEGCER